MDYFILDENNCQQGAFSIEELKFRNVKRNTKVWCQGMPDWAEAQTVEELKGIFDSMPPIPSNSATSNNSSNFQYFAPFTFAPIYDEYFDVNQLSQDEKNAYKKHFFFETFNVGVCILLHFLTLGIFTVIYCGLKHSKLPKVKSDDFGAGQAIGFLFIPFYNIYWNFVFWRRLVMRINLQFRLRGKSSPVSLGLATAICIIIFIPYLGWLLNFFILMPILLYQIQSATNKLARENIQQNQNFIHKM